MNKVTTEKRQEKRVTMNNYLNNKPKFISSPYSELGTIGELKKLIKKYKLPDDTPVLFERIEDTYFTEGNWKRVTFNDEALFPGEADDSEFACEFIESKGIGIYRTETGKTGLLVYGHI